MNKSDSEKQMIIIGSPPISQGLIDQLKQQIGLDMEIVQRKSMEDAMADFPIMTLQDYSVDLPEYNPDLEVGHDGKRLPKHMRNHRNPINSNKNRKRKK